MFPLQSFHVYFKIITFVFVERSGALWIVLGCFRSVLKRCSACWSVLDTLSLKKLWKFHENRYKTEANRASGSRYRGAAYIASSVLIHTSALTTTRYPSLESNLVGHEG